VARNGRDVTRDAMSQDLSEEWWTLSQKAAVEKDSWQRLRLLALGFLVNVRLQLYWLHAGCKRPYKGDGTWLRWKDTDGRDRSTRMYLDAKQLMKRVCDKNFTMSHLARWVEGMHYAQAAAFRILVPEWEADMASARKIRHPGFAAVQTSIAKREGISADRAGAILASASRGASKQAKKANPRLKRVKG